MQNTLINKKNKTFNYDNNYYELGIGGFHEASIPYIHANFNNLIKINNKYTIIDFGCGNGFHCKYLRSFSKELTGVDYSDAIQNNSNKLVYDFLYKKDLGTPADLPLNHYDILFSVEVIEHVQDYRTFLNNAFTVLKPGGIAFLTTTTYFWSVFLLFSTYWRKLSFMNLYLFFKGLFGTEADKTRFVLLFWDFFTGHYHGFSKKQLIQGFTDAGFTIKEIKYLPIQDVFPLNTLNRPVDGIKNLIFFIPSKIVWIIGKIINTFFRITGIYAANILVIAEK